MTLTLKPATILRGAVFLPASKSYSIRAFLIASRGGVSRIIAPSDCDDAKIAMSVARQLGAKVRRAGKSAWIIEAKGNRAGRGAVSVGESGTVLRFVLPLLPYHFKKVVVRGEGTLKGRPNHHLTRALRAQGMKIRGAGAGESVPIIFNGGSLKGGALRIQGTVSSQFVSALLIACPQLPGDTVLTITGPKVVSADYIVMTEQVLKKSGVRTARRSARSIRIKGRQTFKGLKRFTVPSDFGLAAFLMAAGALNKSRVVLKGHLDRQLPQADGRIFAFLKKMGVRFKMTRSTIILKGPFKLKGGTFSLKDCPDLVPVMTVLAMFARGKTRLKDIAHARVKESNRISDLRRELLKAGAKIVERKSELIITPQPRYKTGVLLDPHRDHRMAMAFCVLGTRIGVRVKDIGCVSKSYPGFVKDFKRLGVKCRG